MNPLVILSLICSGGTIVLSLLAMAISVFGCEWIDRLLAPVRGWRHKVPPASQ
jgi:hypothetical protein